MNDDERITPNENNTDNLNNEAVNNSDISQSMAESNFEKSVENMSQAAQKEAGQRMEQNRNYTYYNVNSSSEGAAQYTQPAMTNKKSKKRMSLPKKIGFAIAIAAICGLVGGSVFYGVNFAADRIFGNVIGTYAQENNIEEEKTEIQKTELKDVIPDNDKEDRIQTEHSDVSEVVKECMPSLVTIATVSAMEMQSIFGGSQEYEVQGAGSGVIVGSNDTELLIATNNHVISDAKSLSVGFIDETSVEAQIKGADPDNDLAIIAVKLEDIPEETKAQIKQANIGDSEELELGDQVIAIGNALGVGQSVTCGYVSAFNRDLVLSDGSNTFESTGLIQTDAAINSGNSGGALINMNGELIGINEAKTAYSLSGTIVDGIGYAIPISKALPILEDLMSLPTRTAVSEDDKGYLGVTCANVTEELSNSYNMPIGVCVTDVMEGGAAQAGGIIKGDVITKIDGYEVETYDELVDQLQYYAVGDTVDITIMRANAGEYIESDVSVTLTGYDVLEQYTNDIRE